MYYYRLLKKLNDDLRQQQKKVILYWIPGHENIYGNELADKLAKAGTEKTNIDIIPIPSYTRGNSEIKKIQSRNGGKYGKIRIKKNIIIQK